MDTHTDQLLVRQSDMTVVSRGPKVRDSCRIGDVIEVDLTNLRDGRSTPLSCTISGDKYYIIYDENVSSCRRGESTKRRRMGG